MHQPLRHLSWWIRLAFDMTIPLGSAVLPDEYCTIAGSDSFAWWRSGGSGCRAEGGAWRVNVLEGWVMQREEGRGWGVYRMAAATCTLHPTLYTLDPTPCTFNLSPYT